MALMKKKKNLTWKTMVPSCYKIDTSMEEEDDDHEAGRRRRRKKPVVLPVKQTSFQRLSLSDLSNLSNPASSPLSVLDDISNSLIGSNLYTFTLAELRNITNNFSPSNLLGEGGFGPVYKGFIDDNLRPKLKAQPVAVKLLDLDGLQGHREWLAEIIFLGQLRHAHLVKLIGYCCEDEHRLLIYEYMARGSLENQLFRRYCAALPWSTRMKILLGAAKGLAFLHEGEKPVIYRDFKASNILLDADYTCKLSDFGLAKDGPEGDDTHVSTRIMGTHGYAAPEYIMTGHLTTMSDVYSFGVVLLEVITGRRSMDKTRPNREQNLVEWGRPLLRDPRRLERLIDSRLEGQYSTKGAQKAAELAYRCLSHQPKARPTMADVVNILEPLQGFDDTVIHPFVYVVPAQVEEEEEEKLQGGGGVRNREIKERDGACAGEQHRAGWRRRRIRLPLSVVAYSEPALYKNLRHELNATLKHISKEA